MSLFHRRPDSSRTREDPPDEVKQDKGSSWKRPANTAFKQQRLKAWQPILTPRTVLPTFFLIAVIFAPIGGLLLWGSSQVSEITIDYTGCSGAGTDPTPVPNWNYNLRASDSKLPFNQPSWSFNGSACTLEFELPADLNAPVFLYYRLTNFYQNHRRYVRSLDTAQLSGTHRSASDLDNSDCWPLSSINRSAIYPCGLIANSMFNDTLGNPVQVSPSNQVYEFSYTGIAWPGEAKKYVAVPNYQPSEIVPPPNWAFIGTTYTADNIPNLQTNEHFQNWMRTAGLPTFSKLYGRNDSASMPKGTYQMAIQMNFPVNNFGGTKSVVLSTVSWIGGKNPFLGWAYVATAGLFMLLAIAGTIRHCIKPRQLGDMSKLSWNQPSARR